MVPKRVFETEDATTVTPPPEKILDALRAATKRPSTETVRAPEPAACSR